MAAPQSSPQNLIIAEDGDLELRLYKVLNKDDPNEKFKGVTGDNIKGTIVATMKVSRQVLIDNTGVGKASLCGDWAESKQDIVDMEVSTLLAVETVYRALHGTLNDASFTISSKCVWEVIQYCYERDVELQKLKGWFDKWIDAKKIRGKDFELEEMRTLLYPAYVFDDAEAFAFLTKSLAYRIPDHISEFNPTAYRSLHLNRHMINAMNAARGTMRSNMLRGLFGPLGTFHNQSCDCKKDGLWAYTEGLIKTGLWPVQDVYKKSIQEVLDSPNFLTFSCEIPKDACQICKWKIAPHSISRVHDEITDYFDGLCLDCIKMTNTEDIDDEYWSHDTMKTWGRGCRIGHGQPTWYFSYMGRKEDYKNHQKENNARKEKEGHKNRKRRFSAFNR